MKNYLVQRIAKNLEKRTNGRVHFISRGGNVIIQYGDYGARVLYNAWDFIFENISYLI